MPCVSLFHFVRTVFLWIFEHLCDCVPERLVSTLTVLEIIYYLIACVYFVVELVVLCLSLK